MPRTLRMLYNSRAATAFDGGGFAAWRTALPGALHLARYFAEMSAAQITAYVANGEPLGKAGAYGIQGRAAAYVQHLSGSYSGIMGLPLFETAQLLRAAGFSF